MTRLVLIIVNRPIDDLHSKTQCHSFTAESEAVGSGTAMAIPNFGKKMLNFRI